MGRGEAGKLRLGERARGPQPAGPPGSPPPPACPRTSRPRALGGGGPAGQGSGVMEDPTLLLRLGGRFPCRRVSCLASLPRPGLGAPRRSCTWCRSTLKVTSVLTGYVPGLTRNPEDRPLGPRGRARNVLLTRPVPSVTSHACPHGAHRPTAPALRARPSLGPGPLAEPLLGSQFRCLPYSRKPPPPLTPTPFGGTAPGTWVFRSRRKDGNRSALGVGSH